MDRVKNDVGNCFFIVLSRRCDIPERMEMSCVKHYFAVMMPCVRCMETMSHLCDLGGSYGRQVRQNMRLREEYT